MHQSSVHRGLGYPSPNIRMHAYGDIASIPRVNNRTQSPFYAFGERGHVFDDAAGITTTAAPSVAASPAAPAVSAKLPVFAASRRRIRGSSRNDSRRAFQRRSRSRGFNRLCCAVVPAAASSAEGSEEWGGDAAAVSETGKRKRKGDRESSAKGSGESGGAAAAAVGETGEKKRKGGRELSALWT